MVELPQGDVTEVRRGDRDALRLLSADMAKLSTTGFIRTERKPKDKMPRVGHILFIEGHPSLAIHEGEAIVFGLEALLEIEDDAIPLETLIAIHELPAADAQRIRHLHTNAHLNLEVADTSKGGDERWWSNVKLRPGSWRREERLPELEVSVEAPEAVRQKSKAYMQRYEGLERMIHPGDALVLDAQDPTSMFQLAGHLATHGRPVLVISRHDIDALSVEHNLPSASCHWLSNSTHPRALKPTIESVRRAVDAFLWENMRAVVLIEGIEYLAGMNGDGATIDFIRDIVDGVRMDDHVALFTVDLNAFDLEPRHRLTRSLMSIQPNELEHWLTEPDLILDHPLCAPPTEEEREWIEQQLQRAIEHSASSAPIIDSGTPLIGGHEPTSVDERRQANDALDEEIESWKTEEAEPASMASEPLPQVTPDPPLEAGQAAPQSMPVAPPKSEPVPPIKQAVEPVARRKEQPQVQVPIAVVKKGPRPAHRVRRRGKTQANTVALPTHVARVAAAAEAPERPSEFPKQSGVHKPTAISSTLESFTLRQERAVERTFSTPAPPRMTLNQAAQQDAAKGNYELPPLNQGPRPIAAVNDRQPDAADEALSPLLARPGIDAEAQPKHLPREIASMAQSPGSIEDHLSVWEREDLERLRQEKEETK